MLCPLQEDFKRFQFPTLIRTPCQIFILEEILKEKSLLKEDQFQVVSKVLEAMMVEEVYLN
jgi:hypothetical protein